jgi:hypothetical protein
MSDPVPADLKDWTWVLQRPCPECGFEPASVALDDVPAIVRANAGAWREVLERADATVRPLPHVWSPLEYACHVRDVFSLYDQRLALMLTEDDPLFANWDQDETAVADRYGAQDPSVVASELEAAGNGIAASFAAVQDDEWTRTGTRSDGVNFTVASFARYFLHDPIHHLHDVTARP